jgi:SAM-dependent methyltransferase
MENAIAWYQANADIVVPHYEAGDAGVINDWLHDFLPDGPALALDIGAGSGRDAAWLASRGIEVVAAEPAAAMREAGQKLHPDASVRWMPDRLPGLEQTTRTGLSFDLILMNAVWQHVAPTDRERAFRKAITLLKPGGIIAVTLRDGPEDTGRGMHGVSAGEIEKLARNHGAFVELSVQSKDHLGREDIEWTQMAIRLPDDGTGALPLLRHIILNDDKSSTYKLALLRVLCRIADGAGGYARDADDDHVSIPLGLVALYWIKLFKPLLAADLPQSPRNRGFAGLGFVGGGFHGLMNTSHHDLSVGIHFTGRVGAALHQSLRDASQTIAKMPATYMTFPNGGPVFPTQYAAPGQLPQEVRLEEVYLSSFGEMRIPRHLWRALQRFDAWIEPALIAEWIRLMKVYAGRQDRKLSEARIGQAMTWSDPKRDVSIASRRAKMLIEKSSLRCVWSDRKLTDRNLDIDHCFPWSAWPCNDLWNLLPSHRDVNQNKKRDRLPGSDLLRSAQDRITQWWQTAYSEPNDGILAERFALEALASLPGLDRQAIEPDDIFNAVSLQRMRLRHDQQVPEWEG